PMGLGVTAPDGRRSRPWHGQGGAPLLGREGPRQARLRLDNPAGGLTPALSANTRPASVSAGPGQVPKAQSGKVGVKATARVPLSSRNQDRERHLSTWSAIAGQVSASTSWTVGRWPTPGEQSPNRRNRNEEDEHDGEQGAQAGGRVRH